MYVVNFLCCCFSTVMAVYILFLLQSTIMYDWEMGQFKNNEV